jgi:2-polyprenyl-3-methyl-5-hydroxy-6-metoxy-1,4-benzoquinol methylase
MGEYDYKSALNSYQTPERAARYKKFQETNRWGSFVTLREQKAVARELRKYKWGTSDQLLDIPCGTGILGRILHNFPFKIIASDISEEMMALAKEAYPEDRLIECIKKDITNTSFPRQSFACVITLGFLHLVPPEIKRDTLKEIAALTTRVAIVSCSVDTPLQRIKKRMTALLKPDHAAPCPAPLKEVIADCEAQGFKVVRSFMVVPFLSSHAILVLEK